MWWCSKEVLDGLKDSPRGPWKILRMIPLFDPPQHDTSNTIQRALELGVNVEIDNKWLISNC